MKMKMKPLMEVAASEGVHRNTLARWIKEKRLKRWERRAEGTSHLLTTFVDPAEVRALAKHITRGRTKRE